MTKPLYLVVVRKASSNDCYSKNPLAHHGPYLCLSPGSRKLTIPSPKYKMSTISRRVRFRSVRGGCVDIDQTVGEETPFPPARETDPTSEAVSAGQKLKGLNSSHTSQVPSRGFSPSIPVDYGWKKAGGVIEPTFGPCRNFRDLEAIVSNCEAGGMSEFRTIFYWYRSKYHSASSSREKGESLSWSSAYANFVFLACEFANRSLPTNTMS
jgi:hypothetical protein